MRRPVRPLVTERLLPALVIGLGLGAAVARADNAVVPDLPSPAPATHAQDVELRLDLRLRGRSTGILAQARRGGDGALRVKGGDLRDAGLQIAGADAQTWVRLDSVAGLTCRYLETQQTLDCDAPDWLLAPRVYNATPTEPPPLRARADYGAALGYDLYSGLARWGAGGSPAYSLSTVSATLDARLFTPYATLQQTGLLGEGLPTGGAGLRYDTTAEYVDDDRLFALRGGDFVSGGLDWSRPARMGGVQIASDFSPRPDLVLHPMPSVGGSAAVPTSVDVYMNDFKVFSQSVEAGPYRIANLPAMGEAGTAMLALRDSSGKEATVSAPYFVSPRLLSQGLVGWDLDAGWARTNYGLASFSYDPRPVGEATLRYGLRDTITLESHAEGGAGLFNGGAGATFDVLGRGVVDAAVAGSDYRGERGLQLALGARTGFAGFDLELSTQRAFGDYLDLAAVTAPHTPTLSASLNAAFGGWLTEVSFNPPRAVDRASLGYGQASAWGRVTASLTSLQSDAMPSQRLASLGYVHALGRHGEIAINGFAGSLGGARTLGALAGLSWTFDDGLSASVQGGRDMTGPASQISAARTGDESVGSSSWRATASNTAGGAIDLDGAYVTRYARLEASASRVGAGAAASAQTSADVQGSLVLVGGEVAAGPPLRGSFALVDVGLPGVAVTADNRPVGTTDGFGRLLVTDLNPFETYAIGVDPLSAPQGADFVRTQQSLRLRDASGALVELKAARDAHGAEVRLVDAAGKPIEAGNAASVNGGAASLVGYDGRVYFPELAAHNRGLVTPAGCVFAFDYPAAGRGATIRPTIGPIACAPPPGAATAMSR